MELDAKYNKNLLKVEWNLIYKDELEILEDLKKIKIPICGFPPTGTYVGYEYIHSFAKQVQGGKHLSEKQMKQCKRLALEIKKAATISHYM